MARVSLAFPARPTPAGPLLGAMAAGAVLVGLFTWRVGLQSIDRQITAKRAAVRKLVLSGAIPPNQEVADYLAARQAALEAHYQLWLSSVATPLVSDASAQADPQLYFQEQVHEMQRALERFAAARSLPVPEQLGFPKELPPTDTVPRLLVQTALVQELAALAFEHEAQSVNSLKVDDPQPVAGREGEGPFVLRLPVRLRLTATLPQLMKILGAIEQKRPLIDVRSLRVSAPSSGEALDIEMVLARYLALTSTTLADTAEDSELTGEPVPPAKKAARAKSAAGRRPAEPQ